LLPQNTPADSSFARQVRPKKSHSESMIFAKARKMLNKKGAAASKETFDKEYWKDKSARSEVIMVTQLAIAPSKKVKRL